MAELTLTQEMIKHPVIVSLAAGHSNSEIAAFLRVARSFVFKIRRELEVANGDVATILHRKRHYRGSDITRTSELTKFVQYAIEEDSGKSMRVLNTDLQAGEVTIRYVVHSDLRYKSYVMWRGQFLYEKTKENRVITAKCLFNKLKHLAQPGLLWFFSDEKHFIQDLEINQRNDRWLCKTSEEVPTVMHTKFPPPLWS